MLNVLTPLNFHGQRQKPANQEAAMVESGKAVSFETRAELKRSARGDHSTLQSLLISHTFPSHAGER